MRALVLVLVGFARAAHAHQALGVSKSGGAGASRVVSEGKLQSAEPVNTLAALLLAFDPVASFNPSSPSLSKPSVKQAQNSDVAGIKPVSHALSRRAAMGTAAATLLSAFGTKAATAAGEENIEVYFGCGCFWHVQHEFVEAEKKILGRSDLQLTALSGYAGGNGGQRDGKVCYHNAMQVSDYGSLGHAEVVGMRIPRKHFRDFAKEYFALFDSRGDRPDQFGDRGLEYRNVVGIPGGKESPLLQELIDESKASGDKLDFAIGKGSDPDARAAAFIMDTNKFPFYQAEVYHQFHDGFNWGEDYPNSYNGLTRTLFKGGQVKDQGCPNGLLGIGLAGL